MTAAQGVILATLVLYQAALVTIGLLTSRLTRDSVDFFLGGRRLGGVVAAISASASSSSAWTLLGVSGAAYLWGLSALWLFPATLSGFLLNWLLIAPRLRRLSRDRDAVTVTDLLATGRGGERLPLVARIASGIILFSFSFYVAAQFQAAGAAFDSQFGLDAGASIVAGATIVVLYTLLGGFWAVSVTDTLQGLLMAATAVVLPVAGVVAAGGPGALWTSLAEAGGGGVFGGRTAPAALGFVLGTLGIGLGYPGQPHVLNRFMALRDAAALTQARWVAITWAVVVYAGMLVTGWCARLLLAGPDSVTGGGEAVFYALTGALFPPILAGVMLAAVLSAIMSTADSQLLVAGSAVAHDLRSARDHRSSLAHSRRVVLGLSALALALALFAPQSIFARVLFAWHAVGSAFGPLLVALLAGVAVPGAARVAAMLVGALGTVALHWLPGTPGDVAERLAPLAAASAVVLVGCGFARRGN